MRPMTLLRCAVALAGAVLLPAAPVLADPIQDCRKEITREQPDVSVCLSDRLRIAEAGLVSADRDKRKNMRELDQRLGGRSALQAFERSAQAFRNYRAAHCNWWSVRSGRPDLEQKLACEIDLVELRMRTLLLE